MDERSILGGVGRLTLQTFPEFEKMPLQKPAEDVVMSPRVTALSEGNATSIQDMAECGFAAAQWAGRVCCQLLRERERKREREKRERERERERQRERERKREREREKEREREREKERERRL